MSSVGSGSHLCAVIDLRPVTFLEHCFALSLVSKVMVLGTWKWPINVPCSAVLWQQSTCQPTAGQSTIRASSDTIQFASCNTVHVKSHNQNIGNIQQSIWDINYFVVFVVAQAPWRQYKCLNFKISLYLIVNVPCLTGLLFCLFAYTLQTHPKNKGDKEKTTIITIIITIIIIIIIKIVMNHHLHRHHHHHHHPHPLHITHFSQRSCSFLIKAVLISLVHRPVRLQLYKCLKR